MKSELIYDFIGIGIGPFNLGLACLTDPIDDLNGLFLDQRSQFHWHPGLLFEDARLQTPFMSDLVTLADPTSPYSFLNYIKQQGRLYSFYIRENFFLLRNEFNQYCQWAASNLGNLRFDTQVENIIYDKERSCYCIQAKCKAEGKSVSFYAKKLVLGTGPTAFVPECCEEWVEISPSIIHASDYLHQQHALKSKKKITVVGSGQSAAEIIIDLLQDIARYGYTLNWITRAPRFFPLEYTKLTLEMTSPEYVDYFYELPSATRESLNREHAQLAKGINSETINQIFDLMYAKRLISECDINLLTNSELEMLEKDNHSGNYFLHFQQKEKQSRFSCESDAVVLSTGYRYEEPNFLNGISDRIAWNNQGDYDVGRYYSIDQSHSEIFVQNAEQHTHGFVTPDLGMACYRNSHIIRQLLGRDHYPIEKKIAFQTFGTPENDMRYEGASLEYVS